MSNETRNLLIELLVEELPPKSLETLGESFGARLVEELNTLGHLAGGACVTVFSTPRRLGVHITQVFETARQQSRRVKLMPVSVGIGAHGEYTPALLKKLELSCGYSGEIPAETRAARISREVEGKTEFLFHTDSPAGASLLASLQQALHASIAKLPIAKLMAYQLADGWTTMNFARPVHGLVVLHGTEIVPVSALGLAAGNRTSGHRFEARVHPILLSNADSYVHQLETEGAVMVSFRLRRAWIAEQVAATATRENLNIIEDEALMDEVTALVERPNILVGTFDPAFLDVPQECLILTMKANQKYFPLLDANGMLAPKFLMVSNICPPDTTQIIDGNERVLRSRLADAKFFFEQDLRKTLDSRVAALESVVYHSRLGSQLDRVKRVQAIAQAIAKKLGGDELEAKAGEAARLAKADLLTGMVGEFPELQGIMGRHYALREGVPEDIAYAIEDHYKPRFAGDELPRGPVGICLALADKMETLTGVFGMGEAPTGDKDPHALRRHALGVVRILIEKNVAISLDTLIRKFTLEQMPRGNTNLIFDQVFRFLEERGRSYFTDQGFESHVIESVLLPFGKSVPLGILANIIPKAAEFLATEDGRILAEANKRITNILKKSGQEIPVAFNPGNLLEKPDTNLFQTKEEAELWRLLQQVGGRSLELKKDARYAEALANLASLAFPIRTFFEQVLVNAEDPAVRNNRITLLQFARAYMNQVADLSMMMR